MTGSLMSSLVFGSISSTFGRKPCIICSFTMSCLGCIGLGFAPNYILAITCYFIMGVLYTLNTNTSIYLQEIGNDKFRSIVILV